MFNYLQLKSIKLYYLKSWLGLFLFLAVLSKSLYAQILSPEISQPSIKIDSIDNVSKNEALISVFLDCRDCRESFIKSEITFVNFVRDMADAEVHLIITQRGTASGGSQYQLAFLGYENYSDLSQNLTYTTFDSDTYDEERSGLVKYVKLGLVPYLSKKEVLSDFNLEYTGDLRDIPSNNEDKWNNWIFEIGSNGSIYGEENDKSFVIENRLNVRRTTDTWKFRLWVNNNYRLRTITTPDTLLEFSTKRQYAWGQLVYSLSDHWSIGTYFGGSSSTRDNIELSYGISPTIEYSFYPYREFARREVTLRYGISPSKRFYEEKTIYGKNSEILLEHQLNFNMDYTKPWGSVKATMEGTTYFHDLNKYRLNVEFEFSKRIIRGFSIFVNTEYSIINNQLSLSAQGVTDEEAIANIRQQATSYSYRTRLGFEISFGSIYDSVVNTRF